MQDMTTDEMDDVHGGSCWGALGVAGGLIFSGPFTGGITAVAGAAILGGMLIADC
jgi:hypothetical protein